MQRKIAVPGSDPIEVGVGLDLTDGHIKAVAKAGVTVGLNAAENLYLLVNNKGILGSHRWIFRWMKNKKPAEYGLGTLKIEGAKTSGVSLEKARTEARKCRDIIAADGDPRDVRRKEKQDAADTAEDERRVAKNLPARDSFRQYAEEFAAKKKIGDLKGAGQADGGDDDGAKKSKKRRVAKWGKKSSDNFANIMTKDVYPAIGNKNVKTITTEDCYSILAGIEARAALSQMERTRNAMNDVFEMVRKRRIIEENPISFLDGDTLAEHIGQHHPAVKTAQALRDVLLKLDAQAATPTQQETYSTRGTARAVALQVLLWQRPHMIAHMRKDWIDWDGARAEAEAEDTRPTIYFPFSEMKLKPTDKRIGTFHAVPLSPQAEKILREQIDKDSGNSPYVFPKHGDRMGRMCSTSLNNSMQTALGRINTNRAEWVTYQDAHGLRSVALTMGADYIGLDKNVLNSLQAHAAGDKALGDTYDRSTYAHLRRDAMNRWADWIDAVRAGKKYAMTLPKSALSATMQNQLDAEKWRELERSGELAEFLAYKAAKTGEGVAALNVPIIRADNTSANDNRDAA